MQCRFFALIVLPPARLAEFPSEEPKLDVARARYKLLSKSKKFNTNFNAMNSRFYFTIQSILTYCYGSIFLGVRAHQQSTMSTSTISPSKIEKKRKREAKEDHKPKQQNVQQQDEGDTPQVEEGSSKKKKRRRNKQISEETNDEGKKDGVDESIGKMDGPLLADFFAQQTKRANDDLTAVELSDLYIPGMRFLGVPLFGQWDLLRMAANWAEYVEQAFLDTSSWDSSRKLDDLPRFLKKHSPKKGPSLSEASTENGSPHTLVVTLAGLRAADITRLA